MDDRQSIRPIDPDVLQCKADLLRAQSSGIIEQEKNIPDSKQSGTPSSEKPLPYALRPLDRKVGQAVTPECANTDLPPALRPLGGQIKWPQKPVISKGINLPITVKPFLNLKIERPKTPDLQYKTPAESETSIEPQKSSVPKFNLAEQILNAQRTAVASRRQKSTEASPAGSAPKGIEHVVESITSKSPPIPVREIPATGRTNDRQFERKASFSFSNSLGTEHDLIARIVAQDIRHFCES